MEPHKKPDRSGTTGETAAHSQEEEVRAQLAAIVDSSEDAIISRDLNGIILSWNRGAERMFGYRAEEIVGLPVGRLLPPDRIAEDDEIAGRLRSGEHVQTRETVRVAKDGRRIEVSATFSPVRDPGGAVVGISNILRDIAARKQSERALRESEERLRFALETSRIGAWDLSLEDHTALRSLEHDRIFGYAQLLPRWTYEMFLDHVLPEDRAAVDAKFRQAVATQGDWSFECRIRRLDGEVRWIWAAGRHRAVAADGTRLIAGIVQDVTDRKRAEQALRESEERLHSVLRSSSVGTFEFDLETGEGRWNEVEFELLGLRPGDAPGNPETFFRYVHPDDLGMLKAKWEVALRTGGLDEDFRIVRADGQERWLTGKGRFTAEGDPGGEPRRFLGINFDITERKLAEQALRTSEERYRLVAETMSQGVVHQDASGKIIAMNPAAERILGKSRKAFLGSDSVREGRDTIREDHSPFPGREHPSMVALRTGREVRGEVMGVFHPRLGAYRWISIDAVPVCHPGETRPCEVYTMFEDITERKEAAEALSRERDFVSAVLETAGSLVVVLDSQGRITRFNRMCEQITGYTAAEVRGRVFWEFLIAPEEANGVREVWRALTAGNFPNSFENHWLNRDGSRRLIAWSNTALVDDSGRVEHVIATGIDITERKRAEQQLFDANQRLQALMNAVPVGVSFSHDPTCRNITGNPAVLAQFDATTSDNLSASASDESARGRQVLFFREGRPITDADLPLQRAVAENQAIPAMELEVVMPSGRRWFADASGAPIRDAQGNVIGGVSVTVDITGRKRAEEDLRQANINLEHKVQERTEELAQRAAQLRALAGELTLFEQRERRRMAKILHDHLQQLLVAAKFRATILGRGVEGQLKPAVAEIDDLLDESINTSRSLTAELSPPILHEGGLVPGLQWLARWMTDKHHLTVDLLTEDNLPALPDDVKVLLFESVRELLFNAAKYAHVRSASVQVRVADDRLRIVVSDEGVGFDPGQLRPAGASGGGFGLFGIRERLDLFGGRFEIDSAPGRGSRFVIEIPVEQGIPTPDFAGVMPAEELQPTWIEEPVIGAKIRILLADDHAVMRDGLVMLVNSEPDMEVIGQAADGAAAVELARTLKPDVILMDQSMPRLTGVEATRVITAELPHVKVIGLSMFEESEHAHTMLAAGAVAYLPKSGPSGNILAAIRASLKTEPS